MTIELETSIFKWKIGKKTLEPRRADPIRIQTGRIKNRTDVNIVSIQTNDCVHISERVEFYQSSWIPTWLQPFVTRYETDLRPLSKEEINKEGLRRSRFFGLIKEEIIWRP